MPEEEKVFVGWANIYPETDYGFDFSLFVYPMLQAAVNANGARDSAGLMRSLGGRPRRVRIELLD